MPMKTILVVDDESDVADVVAATLEDEGYRVILAFNGAEGLKRLTEATPDLLICDVMMPFIDGTSMCRQVRNNPAHQHLPIIIASVMDEATVSIQWADHDGFLRKPFRLAELVDMVGVLLEPSRPH
jgi:CheY-like chemotaxis protein